MAVCFNRVIECKLFTYKTQPLTFFPSTKSFRVSISILEVWRSSCGEVHQSSPSSIQQFVTKHHKKIWDPHCWVWFGIWWVWFSLKFRVLILFRFLMLDMCSFLNYGWDALPEKITGRNMVEMLYPVKMTDGGSPARKSGMGSFGEGITPWFRFVYLLFFYLYDWVAGEDDRSRIGSPEKMTNIIIYVFNFNRK